MSLWSYLKPYNIILQKNRINIEIAVTFSPILILDYYNKKIIKELQTFQFDRNNQKQNIETDKKKRSYKSKKQKVKNK